MEFAQKLLLVVPTPLLCMLVVLVAVLLSIIGLWLVWRFIPRQLLKTHNDLTDPMFEAVSLAYTVLLAFVVVVAWQNFDKAGEHAVKEANCIVDLHRNAAAFENPFKDELQSRLESYTSIVINEEWQSLARGVESANAHAALRKVWELYENYEPKTNKEKAFFAQSLTKLDQLSEMRRLRIIDSRSGIHPLLWFILIIGAVITVAFTFFFGSDKFIVHVIMASTLSAIIALILFTILSFDFPFTGSVRIEPSVFQEIADF
ncbi:MAG: DUF4239 domain-containing protein [Candidatus Omnitrophica bacterium]|nr:DUF4239 domain-containing protein [Candidatus Omnitrophota bacterium]